MNLISVFRFCLCFFGGLMFLELSEFVSGALLVLAIVNAEAFIKSINKKESD